MVELPVNIRGVGMHSPRFASARAWRMKEASPTAVQPSGEWLDRRTRRRASLLSRALADAYGEACNEAQFDASSVASVFGSALGECDTMIRLLEQMWTSTDPLSPMAFAMSVHNAAAGLVSISGDNHGFATSLAADFDTPAMALIEAIGWVHQHRGRAVVVCGDEGTPEALVGEDDRWPMVCCAIAIEHPELTGATDQVVQIARLTRSVEPAHRVERATLSLDEGRNPAAGLWDLAHASLEGVEGAVRLDRGRGAGWVAELRIA